MSRFHLVVVGLLLALPPTASAGVLIPAGR